MIKINTEENIFECEGIGRTILDETLFILEKILSKIYPLKVRKDFIKAIIEYLKLKGGD